MTLPNEEFRALIRSRECLRALLMQMPNRWYFLKLAVSTKARRVLCDEVLACLHHFPYRVSLEHRYGDVCHRCGECKQWCKCKKEEAA